MSNQQKADFVNNIFRIPSFWGGHGIFFAKNLMYAGRSNLPRISDSATGRVSDSHNSQIANRLEQFNRSAES
jgi:hypothetical protein